MTEFAKKTGDYPSLSATDIKVIALTYRYEREKVGTSHLKTEPIKSKQIVDSSIKKPEEIPKNVVGFYLPNENVKQFFLYYHVNAVIFKHTLNYFRKMRKNLIAAEKKKKKNQTSVVRMNMKQLKIIHILKTTI